MWLIKHFTRWFLLCRSRCCLTSEDRLNHGAVPDHIHRSVSVCVRFRHGMMKVDVYISILKLLAFFRVHWAGRSVNPPSHFISPLKVKPQLLVNSLPFFSTTATSSTFSRSLSSLMSNPCRVKCSNPPPPLLESVILALKLYEGSSNPKLKSVGGCLSKRCGGLDGEQRETVANCIQKLKHKEVS